MLRSDGAEVQSVRTYGTGNCATNAGRRRPEIMLNRTCRALQRYAALQLASGGYPSVAGSPR